MKFGKKSKQDNSLSNPFAQIAQGLLQAESGKVWEEEPADIVEFVESKKFLNQKWNGRTGCRPLLLDILVETMKSNVREAIWLLGKGSGKDFGASILHLYGIYYSLCLVNPQSYYGLGPSPIYFVNTARNDTQAKKVFFTQFKILLSECPWFTGKYNEPALGFVSFNKNIEAISVNSQAYGWLGFNTIQWVGDELAFFLANDNDDESESRADECWNAAFGSCKTRFPNHYKMIGITTPRDDDDFVMKKYEELSKRDDGYVKQAATWDINPLIKKEDFKYALAKDYRKTMRDFGAIPSGVIDSFWPEPEAISQRVAPLCKECPVYINRKKIDNIHGCWEFDDCKVNPYVGDGEWREWFIPPQENNEYVMHIDLAKTKDRLGFAMGRIAGETKMELDAYQIKRKFGEDIEVGDLGQEDRFAVKPLIRIEALGWISTRSENYDRCMLKNGDYDYNKFLDKIIMTLQRKGFNIALITFDQYQSLMMKQTLEDKGFQTDLISLDRTDEIPVAAKYAILEDRVWMPHSELLLKECKFLKHIRSKKVDHSQGKSKDLWDSVAGTIWNCETTLMNSGSFVGLEYYE